MEENGLCCKQHWGFTAVSGPGVFLAYVTDRRRVLDYWEHFIWSSGFISFPFMEISDFSIFPLCSPATDGSAHLFCSFRHHVCSLCCVNLPALRLMVCLW